MRIELSPEAKREFEASPERLGMTQLAATNRLIAWFVRQPGDLQLAILKWNSDSTGDSLTTQVLRQMISKSKISTPRRHPTKS